MSPVDPPLTAVYPTTCTRFYSPTLSPRPKLSVVGWRWAWAWALVVGVGRRRCGLVGALVVVVGGGGERRRANSEEVGGSHALAGRDRDRIGGGRPSLSLGLRGRFPARDGLGSCRPCGVRTQRCIIGSGVTYYLWCT